MRYHPLGQPSDAPVAEHVSVDDVIKSLKPMGSDDSLFRIAERADVVVEKAFQAIAREQPADVMVW